MNPKETELKKYIRKIKESGAKITPQRIEILELFLEQKDEHYTADDILKRITNDSIGQATIYRTLELFCQLQILKKINFKNEEFARYDLLDLGNKHYHHHLICEKCGKVIEINDDLLENLEDKIKRDYNFLTLNHELVIRGLCNDCQKIVKSDD